MSVKELAVAVLNGYGEHAWDTRHEEYGACLWVYKTPQIEFSLFQKGLTFHDLFASQKYEIKYSEINGIKSFLTVELISQSSISGSEDQLIPLELTLVSEHKKLTLPLAIYSLILKALWQLKEQSTTLLAAPHDGG